ncbi:MAG: hypothetical protein FGM63_06125 [Candidatus Nanopelagicaceae bacterium]|nr:hypothetical protein [Candidatus Nanopelagicaceae bacterium]
MELARNILLGLHLLGTIGILVGLLLSKKKLSSGITHSALLSLLTGLALVALRYPLVDADPMKWEEIDNTKISIKLLIVLAILVIGYKNRKKEAVSKVVVGAIAALSTVNILIAALW